MCLIRKEYQFAPGVDRPLVHRIGPMHFKTNSFASENSFSLKSKERNVLLRTVRCNTRLLFLFFLHFWMSHAFWTQKIFPPKMSRTEHFCMHLSWWFATLWVKVSCVSCATKCYQAFEFVFTPREAVSRGDLYGVMQPARCRGRLSLDLPPPARPRLNPFLGRSPCRLDTPLPSSTRQPPFLLTFLSQRKLVSEGLEERW